MSKPAFVRSRRRQALAARHKGAQILPERPPGGRFNGLCELCGACHRQPDLRWICETCGATVCSARQTHMGCPECGGRVLWSMEDGEEE